MVEYVIVYGRKYAYVCRNNGQFHKGDCSGMAGYATFVGKFEKGSTELKHYEKFAE